MEEKKLTGYPSIDKPWLKYYPKEAINAPLPECTIYEYLLENNKDYPKDIALEYLGSKISYGKLFANIDSCEKALTALGVKQGDIVTIALPSVPEVLYIVYALNKMGAVANMIHPLAGEREILHYLNEVQSKIAIIFESTYKIIRHSIHMTSVKKAVVVSAGDSLPFGIQQLYKTKNKLPKFSANGLFMNWMQFIQLGKNIVAVPVKKNHNSVAIISHTGGTTGEPKGVMCSDRNFNALIWQIGCNLPHGRQERYLVVLPPFINYSLANAMLEPLSFGFRVILIPAYDPSKFDEYVKKYRPNHISSIPAYWEACLSNENLKKMDLSCLKYILYGGDAMNEKKEEEVNELFLSRGAQMKLRKGLGSTELVSAATITYDDCNMPGSVGAPLVRVNCKIVEPGTFNELAYNTEGEICFSGDTLMLGYYNKPEATDEIVKLHPDGQRWIHTGDLGYITENGVLFITGRIKRIIMTKGKDGVVTKMFPDRIEKAVLEHPAVGLCCVIGVADENRIHYAKVVVVLNPGYKESEQLTREIVDICTAKLPEYMIPEEIDYRADLPRTERGKVDYRTLEKEANIQ